MTRATRVEHGHRLRVVRHQPIVLDEFLFGEQPILQVVAVLPTTHFVEVVCESGNIHRGWVFTAGVFGQPSFAREARKKIRDSHGRILVRHERGARKRQRE